MNWQILYKDKIKKIDNLVEILLLNRGLKTKNQQEEFLNPTPSEKLSPQDVSVLINQLNKTIKRIQKASKNQEQIIIYGDYDCDGICATAILWETLYAEGAKVLPYIPDRVEEGYGLSKIGLDNLKEKIPDTKLVITVDHGIVAVDQVDYAQKKLGFEVIITDHHTAGQKLPRAFSIIHTTKLSGAGVAWFLAKTISSSVIPTDPRLAGEAEESFTQEAVEKDPSPRRSSGLGMTRSGNDHLALAALGTIADMVPLKGPNRSLAKYGLEALNNTDKVGLLALYKEAGIQKGNIGPYEIGFCLSPRLNALGRIDNALDSLRLLCTKDAVKAERLAKRLNEVNRERQRLTEETFLYARKQSAVSSQKLAKLLFISDKSFNQGIIGLVAGKLVEEFYRPTIVVSRGEIISKASARSINGFNIVEAIRTASHLLIDVGGHPMAAGFTMETDKLLLLEEKLTKLADEQIREELLTKTLKIDCPLYLNQISFSLYEALEKLRPFGMENPEPVFWSDVEVVNTRLVGINGKHLKLRVKASGKDTSGMSESLKTPRGWRGNDHDSPEVEESRQTYDAIAFNFSSLATQIKPGDNLQIAYTVVKDTWQKEPRLQLKIKDITVKN